MEADIVESNQENIKSHRFFKCHAIKKITKQAQINHYNPWKTTGNHPEREPKSVDIIIKNADEPKYFEGKNQSSSINNDVSKSDILGIEKDKIIRNRSEAMDDKIISIVIDNGKIIIPKKQNY